MKIIIKAFCSLILLLVTVTASAQEKDHPKMDWFENARLGIFVHWGIYGVNGIPESWAFFNNYISYDDYMKQLNGFTADKYKPEEWARLIKESGAGYAVITSRHHDGVALWDSKMGGINTRRHTPAKKDVLTAFVKALQNQKLKTGLYYSLPDWSHPDYDVHTRDKKRYELKQDPQRWAKYREYLDGQLKELSGSYNPDLYWFDGDWEHSADEWRAPHIRQMLQGYNKNVIINSRLNGYGDYATPEQGVPAVRPADRYWELCLTMNDSWGYQQHDHNYKTSNQVIRTFIDCISNGGNLLLDIGPKPDGTIPEEQVKILKDLGRWNKKHAEAVFGSRAGIAANNYHGKTTVSADGKTLYLFVETEPAGDVRIRNLKFPPSLVKVVGSNSQLDFKTFKETGTTYIKLPREELDPEVTVLALRFDKPAAFTDAVHVNYSSLLRSSSNKTGDAGLPNIIGAVADDLSSGNDPFSKDLMPQPSSPSSGEKQILEQLSRWSKKHSEAIEGSLKGLPNGYYTGPSTLSPDRQTLYLFVDGKPKGPLAIKGIKNKIQRVRIVGNGTLLAHQILNKQYWSEIPGMLYINIPEDQLDDQMTVIAILLDKPIDLFGDEVKPIESN